MPFQLKKLPDGDLSLGNLRGELVNLIPSTSDYATGGYLIQGIGGATENTGNVGLAKVLGVLPVGGQGGYNPVWNPATSKLQMYWNATAGTPDSEVTAGTNLATNTFQLLVIGL
jgi:hypothetical protein